MRNFAVFMFVLGIGSTSYSSDSFLKSEIANKIVRTAHVLRFMDGAATDLNQMDVLAEATTASTPPGYWLDEENLERYQEAVEVYSKLTNDFFGLPVIEVDSFVRKELQFLIQFPRWVPVIEMVTLFLEGPAVQGVAEVPYQVRDGKVNPYHGMKPVLEEVFHFTDAGHAIEQAQEYSQRLRVFQQGLRENSNETTSKLSDRLAVDRFQLNRLSKQLHDAIKLRRRRIIGLGNYVEALSRQELLVYPLHLLAFPTSLARYGHLGAFFYSKSQVVDANQDILVPLSLANVTEADKSGRPFAVEVDKDSQWVPFDGNVAVKYEPSVNTLYVSVDIDWTAWDMVTFATQEPWQEQAPSFVEVNKEVLKSLFKSPVEQSSLN